MFIFATLFLLNIHFFYYSNEFDKVKMIDKVIIDINIIYCSPEHSPPNSQLADFYIDFWVHIDLCVNVLIPFSIMIVSSLIIVCKVFRSTKNVSNTKRKSLVNLNNNNRSNSLITSVIMVGTSNTNHQLIETGATRERQASTCIYLNQPLSKRRRSRANSKSKAVSVSKMLALNNMMFICLSLPIVVFLATAPSILNN